MNERAHDLGSIIAIIIGLATFGSLLLFLILNLIAEETTFGHRLTLRLGHYRVVKLVQRGKTWFIVEERSTFVFWKTYKSFDTLKEADVWLTAEEFIDKAETREVVRAPGELRPEDPQGPPRRIDL